MSWPCNILVRLVMQGQKVVGHYRGGAYIDLHFGQNTSGAAFAVINVYDYKAGKPMIGMTYRDVSQAMKYYREELFPHEIEDYLKLGRW